MTMEAVSIATLIIVVILAGIVITLLLKRKSPSENMQSAILLRQSIDALRSQVDQRLEGTTKAVGERLAEVHRGIGDLDRASKRILEVGESISSLQQILSAPKLRGGLGEHFLGEILSQILPQKHFRLQYQFLSGERVDAVVYLSEGLVSIDAKFPLENFKRIIEATSEEDKIRFRRSFSTDVKKHIEDVAVKYIVPEERTIDYALMYIPAENVYYEVITEVNGVSLADYALNKHVIPVSPNSLYAYLQVIAFGLKGLRIQEDAKQIRDMLSQLQKHFDRFKEDFETLGGHLDKASKKYQEADKKLGRFEDKLLIIGEEESLETPPEQTRLLD